MCKYHHVDERRLAAVCCRLVTFLIDCLGNVMIGIVVQSSTSLEISLLFIPIIHSFEISLQSEKVVQRGGEVIP